MIAILFTLLEETLNGYLYVQLLFGMDLFIN